MIETIKVFCFKYEEFKPVNGLYTYQNKQYTNKEFIHFLKKSLIWFNNYYKEEDLNEN